MCTKSQNPGTITKIRALSRRLSPNARISGRARIYPGDLGTLRESFKKLWREKVRPPDTSLKSLLCSEIVFSYDWYQQFCGAVLPPSVMVLFILIFHKFYLFESHTSGIITCCFENHSCVQDWTTMQSRIYTTAKWANIIRPEIKASSRSRKVWLYIYIYIYITLQHAFRADWC